MIQSPHGYPHAEGTPLMKQSLIEVTSRSNVLLLQLAAKLNEHLPSNVRASICAISALRSTRISQTIIILSETDRWEDMRILLRSLVETVINASYLRIASDKELT